MSSSKVALWLGVVMLVSVFASPVMAGTSAGITFQANLNKIDPAVFGAGPVESPLGSSSPGAIAAAPASVPAGLTVAVVKLKNLASDAWQAQGHDFVVSSLQGIADRTQAPIVQLVEANGGVVLNRLWLSNSMLVAASDATFRLIAQNPLVERIHPNYQINLPPVTQGVPDLQNGSYEWNIAKIGAPDAWSLGITGVGVRVCVSDTGFDVTHPDVGPRLFSTSPGDPYYPGGWIEFDSTGNPVSSMPYDSWFHGTHVSGTIAGGSLGGTAIGVAPGVSLMEALVLPGGGGSFEQVTAGIQWCVNPTDRFGNPTGYPADVQSMSWGATGLYPEMLDPIKNSLLAGIIPVAAMGNCGPDCVGTPGAIWGVFGAGATDINDQDASFSSGGVVNWPSPPTDWPFFDSFPATYLKPDFSAPGVNIKSTMPGGGYGWLDGTSMATPHLSATVALMLQASGMSLTPEQAYLNLENSVVDLGPPGQDTRFGYGRIDTYKAVLLSMVKNTGVEGTVYDSASLAPVSNAQVTAEELGVYVKTDANGTFRMGLPEGTYNISVDRFGYYEYTTQIEVKLLNGTLAGYVVDSNGTPILGAEIDVLEAGQVLFTNADGYFETSLKAGTYTVAASSPGLLTATQSVDVAEEVVNWANFTLYPNLPAVIMGTVLYLSNSTPVEGAFVLAQGPTYYGTFTDASGNYMINVSMADAGTYRVGPFKGGHWAPSSWVDITPGTIALADFQMNETSPLNVAIYQDYNGELATLFASAGYNPFDFPTPDAVELMWAVTAFPVVYWSGFSDLNNTDMPTADTFGLTMALADYFGVSVIFGDSYDGWPYGINLLSTYNYDPPSRGFDFNAGTVTWTIMQDHPIFAGIGTVNDTFDLIIPVGGAEGDGDYTWFDGFSGTPLAWVSAASGNYSGTGAAFMDRPFGTEWVLLGSLAPQVWTHVTNDWTANAMLVATNAVQYGMDHSWVTGAGATGAQTLSVPSKTLAPASASPSFGALAWVNLTVYLDPMPSGFVAGTVLDSAGLPIDGVHVYADGTPVETFTDATGAYSLQLPIGDYTIVAKKFGYVPGSAGVSVSEDVTTPLDFALASQRRVGVMYDDSSYPIQSMLESTEMFAVMQFAGNWDDLIAATPGLDLIILSAPPYGGVHPTQTQFDDLLAAASSAHVGVMFLDNVYGYNSPWGYSGYYGLSLLAEFRGDPTGRFEPYGCSGETYEEIVATHGMTRGFDVGDEPLLSTTTCMPFSYFTNFTGTIVGRTWTGYGYPSMFWGSNLAYKVVDGSRWALMAGYAPIYGYFSFWTDAMKQIFVNSAIWASTEPLEFTIDPISGPVGTSVSFTGSLAPASASLGLSFDGNLLTTLSANPDGTFAGTFTVPEAVYGGHTLSVATLDGTFEGDASFDIVASLVADPAQGPPGTVVAVTGHGFPAYAPVELDFPGMLPGMAFADANGFFTGTLAIPSVAGGDYSILAIFYGLPVQAEAPFRVVLNLPLDVQASVGTLHFRGEVVEFYVLVTSGGKMTEASVNVTLWDPTGTASYLEAAEVSPGLYLARYTLSGAAATGTYALVATASVAETYLTGEGAGLATFLVSPTLTSQTAVITSMQGDLAQVRTDTGSLVISLAAVDAHLTAIDGTLATITTSVGTLQADLTVLDAKVTSIQGSVATVSTALGTVQTSLSDLDAAITSVQGTVATITTSIGTLRTNLTALDAKITSIQGNVATVSTTLGTVQTSLDGLHATITNVHGDVADVHSDLGNQTVQISSLQGSGVNLAMYAAIGAVAFSAIAAVVGVLLWLKARRAKEP